MDPEHRLTQTLVELADTLVADFDLVDFLHTLANRSVELLDASEAGLMLADQRGGLRMVASSSERARLLELFEIQNEEGPCLDCFKSGVAVVEEDLEANPTRWPLFGAEAQASGFRSALALPMRWRHEVIGALNLFRSAPGSLNPGGMLAGQAMADIATIGILQERAVREARIMAEQLQSALNGRVVIEQAKGVLAERAAVNMDEAFQLLRAYARAHNRRLHDVAADAISGAIQVGDLSAPAESHAKGG